MAPAVSVVVPLHNGREIIGQCLDSVPVGVELIVVDDCSEDGAPEVVIVEHPRARLLRNERNSGFAATANRGLLAATGDVRIVLNSDARLQPGALEGLALALADPTVGIAGPRLRFPDGSHQLSAAVFPTLANFAAGSFALNEVYSRLRPGRRFPWASALSRREHDTTQDVDWVKGACIAISARCLEATGGFDPGYRMYVEECDLCWRATQLGWRVRYVADAEVEHVGGASGSGDPARQATYNLAGEARFMRRAYGARILRRWRLVRLLSSTLKAMVLAPVALADRRLRARLRWHTTAIRLLAPGGEGARWVSENDLSGSG